MCFYVYPEIILFFHRSFFSKDLEQQHFFLFFSEMAADAQAIMSSAPCQ